MMRLKNPFVTEGYVNTNYFCDRSEETKEIITALESGRNITLLSPRRMGKTGLIKYVFEKMTKDDNNLRFFYIDISHTDSLAKFVNLFAASVLGKLDGQLDVIIRNLTNIFKSCRPVITPDSVTGIPSLSLEIQPGMEEHSLKEIFEYIEKYEKRCFIAIDEFQQIAAYPEYNVEGLLRSYIQFIPNTRFIFSGSKKHLMQEMFTMPTRPFYQSTQTMALQPIGKSSYYHFAQSFFEQSGRKLPIECFEHIYDSVFAHTWYVQYWLSRLFDMAESDVTMNDVNMVLEKILSEEDDNFYTYSQLLTTAQLKVITAVSKNGSIDKPFANAFIQKYGLPAPSTVRSCLEQLIDKDFIIEDRGVYSAYNRFYMLWLRSRR